MIDYQKIFNANQVYCQISNIHVGQTQKKSVKVSTFSLHISKSRLEKQLYFLTKRNISSLLMNTMFLGLSPCVSPYIKTI